MNRLPHWRAALVLAGLLAASAAFAQADRLVSIPVDYAPVLDGVVSEAFWADAPVFEVETVGAGMWGADNASESTVRLQSVYTPDSVYFLVRWSDPTYSIDRQRWVLEGDAWSRQDQTPLREGGASTYYEDKFAFLWVMDAASILADESFWPTYLEPEDAPEAGYDRPIKSMPEGESLDMWHFKYVRTNFSSPAQVDDQFVDETRNAETANNAGRRSDPGEGGYYNNAKDYTTPAGATVSGPRYHVPGNPNLFILSQDMIDTGAAVEIADYAELMALAEGTRLPGVISRAFTGGRADITAKATWSDGWYTLELGRALDTGTPDVDVIFSDLDTPYFFGVGTFDNAQIAHGVTDLLIFEFGK